jgi:hypothetical protein
MPAFSFSFNSAVRASIGARIDSIANAETPTGKEQVRQGQARLSDRSEARHDRLLAKFVEEEGKGVKLDISA